MDGKISVDIRDHWSIKFHCIGKQVPVVFNKCGYCDVMVDDVYSFIIDSLKNAGLLSKDYKETCCYCFVLKKFGLMEFRKVLSSFHYHKAEDILEIHFYAPGGFNPDNRFNVTIHDYSKVC